MKKIDYIQHWGRFCECGHVAQAHGSKGCLACSVCEQFRPEKEQPKNDEGPWLFLQIEENLVDGMRMLLMATKISNQDISVMQVRKKETGAVVSICVLCHDPEISKKLAKIMDDVAMENEKSHVGFMDWKGNKLNPEDIKPKNKPN